ncbi:MAG TPA: alpha/beta hydrolase [Dehalococcoidia bacterium]|nr:alpha/beta hydrolase [Dehalococcoidia bacterium]
MAETAEAPGLTHHYETVNGIRMHWAEQGRGPLVLLLHGFPEFWYSWRHQLPALAAAGFRAVAPDQRGYNLTEKPAGIGAYASEYLVEDVADLIRKLGEEQAVIVGHDWGGGVAWLFAMRHPELTRRLAVLNCPHPAAMQHALRRNPRQMLRSWYMLYFQIPKLPELGFRAGNYRSIERALRGWARPGTFSDDEIRAYKEAAAQPGALTAAINWYRAAAREFRRERPMPLIETPTLLIWATNDRALGVELTHGMERWVGDLRIRYIPRTSHWVQQEQPGLVNRYLREFLSDVRIAPPSG